MIHHNKYEYLKTIVDNDISVLLVGSAGTGKSTLAKQVAEGLNYKFYSMSLTKQSSVNNLLGFISIDGTYIISQFRKAFEKGGLFLLDEINAADPNVLLCLNTIENGYISFPDGIVEKHKDFRLIATANPEEAIYTARSVLDHATLDRFYQVVLERDPNLEESLTSNEVVKQINKAREIYNNNGITRPITMRDSIRLFNLSKLGIDDTYPVVDLLFNNKDTKELQAEIVKYVNETKKSSMKQSEAINVDELWGVLEKEHEEIRENHNTYMSMIEHFSKTGLQPTNKQYSVRSQYSPEYVKETYQIMDHVSGLKVFDTVTYGVPKKYSNHDLTVPKNNANETVDVPINLFNTFSAEQVEDAIEKFRYNGEQLLPRHTLKRKSYQIIEVVNNKTKEIVFRYDIEKTKKIKD
jgi:MoxR-like ATPase